MKWWQQKRAMCHPRSGKSILLPWIKRGLLQIGNFFIPSNNGSLTLYNLHTKIPVLVEDAYPLPSQSGLIKQSIRKDTMINSIVNWILTAGALIFGVLGVTNFNQFIIGEKKGIEYFLLSGLLFVILTYRQQSVPSAAPQVLTTLQDDETAIIFQSPKRLFPYTRGRFALLLVSILLGLLALILLINRPMDQGHWDTFFLWLVSSLGFAAAHFPTKRLNWQRWLQSNKVDILIVLFLTVVGSCLRLVALGEIPNIISGDEGRFGTILMDILDGNIKNMFITSFGNSTLYFFFLAGMMKWLGVSVKLLRIGSALGGILTIPFLYLFSRQLFNRRIAWISTALLVVSNFHLHFSRIMSVTSIQDALFATISLYFLLTGLLRHSRFRMVMGGLCLGFALYVYMGARLIILLVPIYLIFLYFFQRPMVTKNKANILLFFSAWLLISLPMIYWAISNPIAFNARANQTGILQSGWLVKEAAKTGIHQLSLFLTLFKQAFLTIQYYPSYGFHNSEFPMLDPISSIFFLPGLIYSLLHTKDPRFLLLNGWLWSGILVGGALVTLPSYNAYRILIIFPVVCLFVAIGIDRILSIFNSHRWINRIITTALTLGFVLILSFINLKIYFVNYAPSCKYENTNTRLASLIASYTSTLDAEVTPYLLTAPRLQAGTHLSMDFLSPGREYKQYEEPLRAPPRNLDLQKPAVFFFIPGRESELRWIEQILPGGNKDQIFDCNQSVADVYLWFPAE